jgi:GT2 family glycosyltransferase
VPQHGDRVAVVVATRNRARELENTLRRLTLLPEQPRVVVVDNASTDDTVERVRRGFHDVDVIPLAHNAGAAARTVGVRHVSAPLIAFSDDDSWWEPGSLERAAQIFDAHPRLGLLAGRVLVGRGHRPDATCELMAASPLRQVPDLSSASILGFIACGCVVRSAAYLEVGGFDRRFEIGAEEECLALDLATAGWGLHYTDDVVAHHHPSPVRDRAGRRRRQLRNLLWSAWLRYPWPAALARSLRAVTDAAPDPVTLLALADALRELPWVVAERREVGPELARRLTLLSGAAAER